MDLYYVIGYPVKHSLSPEIHTNFAEKTNQNMQYQALEILPSELNSKIEELRKNPNVKGLSVTVPHKETMYELCDENDELANDIKAVSNVIFTEDRKIYGLNLDGLGIVNDIKNNQNIVIENKNILVIGAGGASKAVVGAIIDENPQSITVTNRTLSKAKDIQKLFSYKANIKIEDFENIKNQYDIIINSTSASIDGKMLPLSIDNFLENSFGYDLMYNENGTIFTQWCEKNSIKNADGKGMLMELSKVIFQKWRNIKI